MPGGRYIPGQLQMFVTDLQPLSATAFSFTKEKGDESLGLSTCVSFLLVLVRACLAPLACVPVVRKYMIGEGNLRYHGKLRSKERRARISLSPFGALTDSPYTI